VERDKEEEEAINDFFLGILNANSLGSDIKIRVMMVTLSPRRV
jgi:hypothetical protein